MSSKRNLPLALLLLAIVLIYANSFNNSFHFDDFHTVTDNPAVRSLGNVGRILRDTTAFSVLPANQTYRPVVTLSLALDYALGHGYVPFWFHLSTMLWFLVLVRLVYVLAALLFERTEPNARNRWLAFGVAAWFGLHPAEAETVNYVIQRGDLYCTLGCVAGLLAYAKYPSARRFGVYLLPFALGMLSKPPAAVFPLLLLLYVFFFEDAGHPGFGLRQRWWKSVAAAAPAAVVAALLLWLQAAMTPKSYAPTILSAGAYRLTQPYVWLRYAATLFVSMHLNVDTDLQAFATLNGRAVTGLLFVAILLGAIVLCSRRRRLYPIAYGLLWFAITLLPTSAYALSEVENDHRMFFSFPGLMMSVIWAIWLGFQALATALGRQGVSRTLLIRLAAGASALLLCGYAFAAHRRNAVWHSEASLWADDVQKSPHNGRGLMIYGLTRLNAGDTRGALDLFQQALVYTPNYPTLEINLGIADGLLADGGSPSLSDTAEGHFQRAMALAPGDDLPHAYYGRWLLNHHRLQEATSQLKIAVSLNGQRGMQRDLLLDAYNRSGDTAAAHVLAQQTLALDPGNLKALRTLHGQAVGQVMPEVAALINASLAQYRAGAYQRSIDTAQQALRLDGSSAEAWNNVGAGYGGLRQWDKAIAAEQEALQRNPALEIAGNNLRWFQTQQGAGQTGVSGSQKLQAAALVNRSLALSQAGQHEASIEAAQKALDADPSSAEAWNNIAAGDEALGRWNEAIAAARHAIALRPNFELAKNNLAWSLQQRVTHHTGTRVGSQTR